MSRRLIAYHCEADEDYHRATVDPETGMCPACDSPPEPLSPLSEDADRADFSELAAQLARYKEVAGEQARIIASMGHRTPELPLSISVHDPIGSPLIVYEAGADQLPVHVRAFHGPHRAVDYVTVSVTRLPDDHPGPRGKVMEQEWMAAPEQDRRLRRARWWRFWDRQPPSSGEDDA